VERNGNHNQTGEHQQLTAPAKGGEELWMEREHGNHARRIDRVEYSHCERELAAGKGGADKAGEQQVDHQTADSEEEPAHKQSGIAWCEGEDQRAEPHQ